MRIMLDTFAVLFVKAFVVTAAILSAGVASLLFWSLVGDWLLITVVEMKEKVEIVIGDFLRQMRK